MSSSLHAIPARLVLPLVMTTPEREPVLRPDYVRPSHEAAFLQRGDHHVIAHRGAPDIGDVARKQRPCIAPIRAVIVQDRAHLLGPRANALPDAPCWIVFDSIRRVSDHQMRLATSQQSFDHERVGAIAADDPVFAEHPHVARHAHRCGRQIRNVVRVRQAGCPVGGQLRQLLGREANQAHVESHRCKIVQFESPTSLRPNRRSTPVYCRRARTPVALPPTNLWRSSRARLPTQASGPPERVRGRQ